MFKQKLLNCVFSFLFVFLIILGLPQGFTNTCGSIVFNNNCPKVIEKVYKNFFVKNTQNSVTKETKYFVDISGYPCGFDLNSDGVIVISVGEIYTSNGYVVSPLKDIMEPGDVLQTINGQSVYSGEDIINEINKPSNLEKELNISFLNKRGEIKTARVMAGYDEFAYGYRLGLWVKNNSVGVGTITYLKDTSFFALGHPVVEQECKTIIPPKDGTIYKCTIMSVQKGQKGIPGELKGLFIKGSNSIGSITNNSEKGLFGEFNEEFKDDFIFKKNVMVANKEDVKLGDAVIISTIDGRVAKEYKIEIVKTNYNSIKNGNCMVIKVKDEELLNATGGIVQGMSGSPILQNGKLIGCVTHVFINDPTRGFASYIEIQ